MKSKSLMIFLLISVILLALFFIINRNNENKGLLSLNKTTELNSSNVIDITSASESETTTETVSIYEVENNSETKAEAIETTAKMIDLEGLTTDFSTLERIYTFNENDYDPSTQDMIYSFFYHVLDDLKQEHEDLSFQILEYKNLNVYFTRVVPGAGPQGYEPKKSDTFLEFTADVEVRYKGYISPVFYFENGTDEFYLITLSDWVLIKEQSTYYLYPYGYYYKTRE